LARTTWQVREVIFETWDLLRRNLLDKPARELRKL